MPAAPSIVEDENGNSMAARRSLRARPQKRYVERAGGRGGAAQEGQVAVVERHGPSAQARAAENPQPPVRRSLTEAQIGPHRRARGAGGAPARGERGPQSPDGPPR